MKIPAVLSFTPLVAAGLILVFGLPPARAQQGMIPAPAAAAHAAARAAGQPLPPMPLIANAPVFALWAPGSAGFNSRALTESETYAMTADVPTRVEKIYGVVNPSIELHRVPANINTGAAIILAPGGGNSELNVGTEGTDMLPFFYNLGVNAIILRYSLRGTGGDANADAVQAMRMVRARASEWGIDPKKIGFAGFSAGAARAAHLIVNFDAGDPNAADPVARSSSRPDFILSLYPSGNVAAAPRNAPPVFIATAGYDDAGASRTALAVTTALLAARVPYVELHMYGHGGHANGMKYRNGIPFGTWQNRFVEWFGDLGFLGKPGEPAKYNIGALSQQAPVAAPPPGERGGRGARGGNAPAPVAPVTLPTTPAP